MNSKQKQNRTELLQNYCQSHPDIDERTRSSLNSMLLRYTRYPQAKSAFGRLPVHSMAVMDFGCGVGDYGYIALKYGHKVTFFDNNPEMIRFVRWRMEGMGRKAEYSTTQPHFREFDAVVFGEVLEHLESPLAVITDALQHVEFLVTSSYPLPHSDEYWQHPGHTKSARKESSECLKLLRSKCYEIKGLQQLRVWAVR